MFTKTMKRFLFILLFSLTSFAQALDSTPEMERIIKQVMQTDGEINKELHDKFWREINTSSKENSDKYTKSMKLILIPAQEYQKELWKSALISYQNNTVVKTQRLMELDQQMSELFRKSLTYPPDSNEFKREAIAFEKGSARSKESAKKLLQAAANHKAFAELNGVEFYPDEDSINEILAKLQASFNRISKLMDRHWIEN